MTSVYGIIAAGGRGTRLTATGLSVPINKSFLTVAGYPVLYYTLLEAAQVCDYLIICLDDPKLASAAEEIADNVGLARSQYEFYFDQGLGLHGLPCHVWKQTMNGHSVLLLAGHAATPASHLKALLTQPGNNSVFSAYNLADDWASRTIWPGVTDKINQRSFKKANKGPWAIALPYRISEDYLEWMPRLGFSLPRFLSEGPEIDIVAAECPIEPDTAMDWRRLERFLTKSKVQCSLR